WGLCRLSDADAVWQVVEVEDSEIVPLGGKVKFPRGTVIYSGGLPGAMSMVMKSKCRAMFERVAAIRESATSGDTSPAATSGYRSPAATSGDRSPAATSGNRSPAATSGN